MKEDKEGTVKEEGEAVDHLEAAMKLKRKMKMRVLVGTRGMRVSTAPVIKILEIKDEEVQVEGVDKEEEAFMVPISIAMKKVIVPLNALNDKEGQIGELRAKLGLLTWMRMHNHHI